MDGSLMREEEIEIWRLTTCACTCMVTSIQSVFLDTLI